ncbi:MAG: YIP1 family protein [Mariprofundaceae bacterium]|nr:YIP1 family protein [Mariprofundaceae bacterium]
MTTYFSTNDPVASIVGAIRDVMTKPGDFFANMPAGKDYGNSVVFLVITLLIPFLMMLFPAGGIGLLILPVAVVFMLLMAWLWAWYLGWAVRRFCHGNLSTADAFQICAYSNAPNLLAWIPVLNIVASFWTLFLEWRGLVSFARIRSGQAIAVLLVPLVVIFISAAILGVLLGIMMEQYGITLPGA